MFVWKIEFIVQTIASHCPKNGSHGQKNPKPKEIASHRQKKNASHRKKNTFLATNQKKKYNSALKKIIQVIVQKLQLMDKQILVIEQKIQVSFKKS